jgi:hypothetical protein
MAEIIELDEHQRGASCGEASDDSAHLTLEDAQHVIGTANGHRD